MRTRVLSFAVIIVTVACCWGQTPDNTGPVVSPEVAALRKQRVDLLQQRISRLRSMFDVGLLDRMALIQPKIDLLTAQAEYATSKDKKRTHLEQLLAEFDQLIEIARQFEKAPPTAARPGRRPTPIQGQMDVLFLQSERVRIQISIAEL